MACYVTNSTGVPFFRDGSFICAPGFYCPNSRNSSTSPTLCPASIECGLRRLTSSQCSGPQGVLEPMVCLPGFYCPDQYSSLPCPKGYFCPTGTVTPRKCDLLSTCGIGSSYQRSFTGIASAAIIDFALLILVYTIKIRQLRLAGRSALCVLPLFLQRILRTKGQSSSLADKTEDSSVLSPLSFNPGSSVSPLPTTHMNVLTSAFRKAMGGRDLRMNFQMDNLGLKLPNGKVVLEGVSGSIGDSRMTAIMGPSGAGKTTFMNVLCGKANRTSGKLWVNEKEAEITEFKKIIGFVPQEDIMHRELTVRENILHAARVRLPNSWSEKQINEHIDNIIQALNLSHVAYSQIGDETTRGISGGQRKRVNIGMELAAAPVCIFLDEPTSGLDATSALHIADILKSIADLGMTIVAVIHQPRVEIFFKFDDVLMVAPGGRTAYLGPTTGVKGYFEALGYLFDAESNVADTLMDILSGKGVNPIKHYTSDELVQLWASNPNLSTQPPESFEKKEMQNTFHDGVVSLVRDRGASILKQIYHCHNRSLMQQYAHINAFVLEVCVGMFAGLLMGLASQGQGELYLGLYIEPFTLLSPSPMEWLISQFGLLIGMAVALAAAPAGVNVFGNEKPVYWRETSSGHSPLAYYIGKSIAALYRTVICSLHFTAIFVVLATPEITFQTQYSMIMLFFFGVYGMSATVSMLVSRQSAPLLGVVVCLFAAVFCGYGPNIRQATHWGVYFIWALSFNMWGCEAQYSETVNIYKGVYDIALTNRSGYTLDRIPFDFGMMVLIGFAWRAVAFILMISLNREKQR
ncbi:hypothetical protein BASA83_002498 [Batrachochytrium salamandrivorans]|nr:hypothetical protein BASA83_002498 [Batrachochytrium salamandrivorans]